METGKTNEGQFFIGQKFEKTYPYTAAMWANAHGCLVAKTAPGIYEIVPVPEPAEASREELFENLREARDGRLAETDYLLMPDYPLDETTRAQVTAYRQALRDLPQMEGAPWDGGDIKTPWPNKKWEAETMEADESVTE